MVPKLIPHPEIPPIKPRLRGAEISLRYMGTVATIPLPWSQTNTFKSQWGLETDEHIPDGKTRNETTSQKHTDVDGACLNRGADSDNNAHQLHESNTA
jgi:hypothetical protein